MRKLIYTAACIFFASAVAPHLAEAFQGIQAGDSAPTRDDQTTQPKSSSAAKVSGLPAAAAPLGNGKIHVGEPYFDFVASTLAGEELRFSTIVGAKATLLHFWGIRCPPCLDEFTLLIDLHRRYRDQGLQVIGVNTDRVDAERLAKTMVARKLDPLYPIVLDPDLRVSDLYTNHFIPLSVLINKHGLVQAVYTGYNKSGIDQLIVRQIEELIGNSTEHKSDVLGLQENSAISPPIPNG